MWVGRVQDWQGLVFPEWAWQPFGDLSFSWQCVGSFQPRSAACPVLQLPQTLSHSWLWWVLWVTEQNSFWLLSISVAIAAVSDYGWLAVKMQVSSSFLNLFMPTQRQTWCGGTKRGAVGHKRKEEREERREKSRYRQDHGTCRFLGNVSIFQENSFWFTAYPSAWHRQTLGICKTHMFVLWHEKLKSEKYWKKRAAYYLLLPSANKMPDIDKLNPSFSMELVRTACAFPWSSHRLRRPHPISDFYSSGRASTFSADGNKK